MQALLLARWCTDGPSAWSSLGNVNSNDPGVNIHTGLVAIVGKWARSWRPILPIWLVCTCLQNLGYFCMLYPVLVRESKKFQFRLWRETLLPCRLARWGLKRRLVCLSVCLSVSVCLLSVSLCLSVCFMVLFVFIVISLKFLVKSIESFVSVVLSNC